jgi:hypothetical protein
MAKIHRAATGQDAFGKRIWPKALGNLPRMHRNGWRQQKIPMDRRKSHRAKPSSALLGLAFDAEDGQKRITRGPNFFLAGGSQETHGVMQETAIKINEHLDRKGKQLADVSIKELRHIVEEIHDG